MGVTFQVQMFFTTEPTMASAVLTLFLAVLFVGSAALAADPVPEKAKTCATCHGEQGVPINKTTPVIWGQDAGYMFYQLRDFKSGARKNDLMSPIAVQLQQEELLPLAEYFSKQKWPNLQQPPAPDDFAANAQKAIASVGCISCHLNYFQGDGTTARTRWPMAGLFASDDAGISRQIARQQSRHV